MAEVLVEFAEPVTAEDGKTYTARACGSEMPDGKWQGWIEFVPLGDGEPVRSARETTQPNRQDTIYWATGLTPVFLEGASARAESARRVRSRADRAAPLRWSRAEPFVDRGADDGEHPRSVLGLPERGSAAAPSALGAGRLAPRQHHPALRTQRRGPGAAERAGTGASSSSSSSTPCAARSRRADRAAEPARLRSAVRLERCRVDRVRPQLDSRDRRVVCAILRA